MPTYIDCNRPRVKEPALLSRHISKHWLLVSDDQRMGISNGRLEIYGEGWPLVQRIPEDMPWASAFPGKAGLGPPEEIDGLLMDISSYLEEPFIVYASGDCLGVWVIDPNSKVVHHDNNYDCEALRSRS